MSLGTIYRLYNTDNLDCYVGSTRGTIKKRLYRHRSDNNKGFLRYGDIFKTDNYKIEVLENQLSLNTLLKRERYWMDLYKSCGSCNCVNKNGVCIAPEEKVIRRRLALKKYKKTEKGKETKKWQNYRYWMKKRLLTELHNKVPVMN